MPATVCALWLGGRLACLAREGLGAPNGRSRRAVSPARPPALQSPAVSRVPLCCRGAGNVAQPGQV